MSVFTASEIAQIKEAYLQLLLGKRVVTQEVGGQSREFQRADLEALRSILEENEALAGNVPLRTYAKNGSTTV